MTTPLISIIIPVYNRANLIGETLNSIVSQTYANWECIVVDDGSTDATATVINTYVKNDERFVYTKRPSESIKGAPSCRNIGLKQSKGDYVMFFDSDDLMPINMLNQRVQLALNNKGYDFCVFQTIRFYDTIENKDCLWNDLTQPNTADFKSFLNLSPVWHTSGPLWNRTFLIDKNLFYTEGVPSWQDWEFHIRVLLISTNYVKFPDESCAALQRFHKNETINKNNSISVIEKRLDLIFIMLSEIKQHSVFDEKEVQLLLFKLFYFVISKLPITSFEQDLWKNIQNILYLVPKIDFWFWNLLLFFRKRQNKILNRIVFRFILTLKMIYFNKRFAVENYKNRSWYKIKSNTSKFPSQFI
ncbi:glycosyltransferase family 2 protein [Winogradskyella psychrotolerans]|uniref:glycosyltransferase family 2 protein n=1 Tax=Winogradskyella psychrotolerans TaxID=1344585 RepID=UPI001C07E18C|nr:glycosyltransferase family 2 protein [Winogradskyella psychrotolerans]MBU2929557.1 glycosyltransferase family 2 protein [Winogradskyella psychrotolerans]